MAERGVIYREALKQYPQKSFDAIAADLGVDCRTIRRWAKVFGIVAMRREQKPRRALKLVRVGEDLVSMPMLCLSLMGGK
jgi:hypothetical protein